MLPKSLPLALASLLSSRALVLVVSWMLHRGFVNVPKTELSHLRTRPVLFPQQRLPCSQSLSIPPSSLCLLPFLSLPHLIRQVPVYSLNFWSPPSPTTPVLVLALVMFTQVMTASQRAALPLSNSATNCTLFLPKWHLLTQKTKVKVLSLAGKLVQSQSPSLFQAWLSPHRRLPTPHLQPVVQVYQHSSSCL